MSDSDDEILYQIVQVGPRTVRVTAMHPPTLTEVAVVGDANYSEGQLYRLAQRKLRYVMARQEEERRAEEARKRASQPQQGRGVRVRKDKLGLMSGNGGNTPDGQGG